MTSPDLPEAFFRSEGGDRFVPTEATRGPWAPEHQHGGPPAALMARALEGLAAGLGGSRLVRLTVEFFRPVPIAPLSVSTEVVRGGRRVQSLTATLAEGEREVARAYGLAVRRAELDLPGGPAGRPSIELDPPPGPEVSEPFEFPFFLWTMGYHRAMECRLARGAFGTGRATIWFRMRLGLVAGERPSGLQRAVAAADSGNGVSLLLSKDRWVFPNPDLTIYLFREPAGEWVGLDSVTIPDAGGAGLAETALYDEAGSCGRSLQSLFIEPAPQP